MNKLEEIKAQKDGLDVLEAIYRYAALGWEAITNEDKDRMKWYGVFFRNATPGHFMLRIRIPNGMANSAQLRAIAGIARDWGRELVDITTRQEVQLRWFGIEHVPEIFARLERVGLTSRQTGMDNVRNIVGCPLAGITSYELLDASPVVRAFNQTVVGNRAFTNLPRKFNVTITGCLDNCTHAQSQDIALTPATKRVGEVSLPGFNVSVGGKLGSGGYSRATPLDVFVTPEEAAEVCAQLALIFRDYGRRKTRGRARFAFLVEDGGVETLRCRLENRLGRGLERAGRDARLGRASDHLGITPQKQPGLYTVGLLVPVGRLSAGQLEEVARLADAYGDGQVRFTVSQNILLPNVSFQRLAALLAEPLLKEFRPDPSPIMRGLVSCTGAEFCNLALAETKVRAFEVARNLERQGNGASPTRPISIHWSGCWAGCGNHLVADIGLQGAKCRINGEVKEVFHVFVASSAGGRIIGGEQVLENVPADEVEAVLQELVAAHAEGRDLVACGRALAAQRKGEMADTEGVRVA